MWDLLEAVGEDRWDALVEAFWAAGASFNTRLTAAESTAPRTSSSTVT